jgi:hypothetical protein
VHLRVVASVGESSAGILPPSSTDAGWKPALLGAPKQKTMLLPMNGYFTMASYADQPMPKPGGILGTAQDAS